MAGQAEAVISKMINKEKFYRLMVWYHGFSIYFRYKNPVALPGDSQFGGKWRFLTIWNVWLQIIFYLVFGILSLFKSNSAIKLRDTLFTALVLPLSVIVSMMFWGIYAVDRELILPVALEKLGYTSTMNHMDHSWILLCTVVNMLLVPHNYSTARIGNSIICGVAVLYVAWLHYLHYISGQWVYPFLAVMTDTTRMVFLGFVCLFGVIIYNIGRVVSNKIHGLEADYNLRSQDSMSHHEHVHTE